MLGVFMEQGNAKISYIHMVQFVNVFIFIMGWSQVIDKAAVDQFLYFSHYEE